MLLKIILHTLWEEVRADPPKEGNISPRCVTCRQITLAGSLWTYWFVSKQLNGLQLYDEGNIREMNKIIRAAIERTSGAGELWASEVGTVEGYLRWQRKVILVGDRSDRKDSVTLFRFHTFETGSEVEHKYYQIPLPPPLLHQPCITTPRLHRGAVVSRTRHAWHGNKQLIYILLLDKHEHSGSHVTRRRYKYANTDSEEQGLCPFAIFFHLLLPPLWFVLCWLSHLLVVIKLVGL